MKQVRHISLSIALFGALLTVSVARATNYPDAHGMPLKVGVCALVNTKSEEDATHVYTLNPDNVRAINALYRLYFFRDARCDEQQFHVDHNTSLSKLETWLSVKLKSRFQSGQYNGQTISTGRREWFYIDNGQARRIPDWLTALSHGLLVADRLSWPKDRSFYGNVKIGKPLDFTSGQYAEKINAVWKNGDRDYAVLPTRLATDIQSLVDRQEPYTSVFAGCTFFSARGDRRGELLDWSWMLHNPGCALASM